MTFCSGKKHSLPVFLNVSRLKINEYYRQAQGVNPRLCCGDLCVIDLLEIKCTKGTKFDTK